jgi:ABC-type nitrate/sulfonate/bicarbonate transport system ATPase subunit
MAPVTRELRVVIEEKSFSRPDGRTHIVLRDVAFRLELSEFVAIVGPSGAGKTTLLNIIAGLDHDFTGTVQLGGGKALAAAPIGFVFQEPRLLPWRTVFENIALVLPRGADPSVITRLLAELGLADAAATYPSRLSLGMARRVALARALVVEPELMLLDEPFVSLDEATARRLRVLLLNLWRRMPCGIILVTHDLREAVELADRILLFSAAPGRLIADVAVTLPRDRRNDRAAVDAMCAEIAPRQRLAAAS